MPNPAFAEIVLAELAANGLTLCRGCEHLGHKRGFVLDSQPSVIHLDRECSTRSTLHRFLHEVGHAIHDKRRMKRWQREEQAERYATESMRQYGISVPRKVAGLGRAYVARMKRWGRNIAAGRRKPTRPARFSVMGEHFDRARDAALAVPA